MEPTKEQPGVVANGRAARLRRDLVPLYALAAAVLCAAGSWYLLKELAPLLRPLILAVFLAYTILPAHRALRRRVPAKVAGPLLVLLVATVVLGLAVLIYGNLIDLKAELPRLIERAQGLIERLRTWGRGHLPVWVLDPVPDAAQAEAETAARLKALTSGLVNTAASFLAEALVVVFYLVFLLLEARRFPERVRAVFPPEQADHVLGILGSINRAMASYLRAKVLSSLVTALPVVAILWAFGVSFPGSWGVLAFVGNFIPLVGSLVALVLPVLLAFLELEPPLRPLAVLVLLMLVQFVKQQLHRTASDRSRRGPQSIGGAGRPGVLGPVLGCGRDGTGCAVDGDAQDRGGEHRAHAPPDSAHGREVKETRCDNYERSHSP